MSYAVLEVHQEDDGVWTAYERPVLEPSDLETVPSLDSFASETATVRVAGELKQLTVYREDQHDGYVLMEEAYA